MATPSPSPTEQNGLALLLTNEASLWLPRQRGKPTRDEEFRIHQGRELSGTLLWGGGDHPANTRVLRGTYSLGWRRYSEPGGPAGEFRCLAVWIEPAALPLTSPSGTSDPSRTS
ncbi:hypothetical protein AB0O01_08730 [Streptomyces sp. NPDC093252]|uniref:hypothetical protein n=1 Tax=Streptomyces sp. NPDC093252 TaxID=3154980 RepID=UPI00341DB449